jgi:hypothetical protein
VLAKNFQLNLPNTLQMIFFQNVDIQIFIAKGVPHTLQAVLVQSPLL